MFLQKTKLLPSIDAEIKAVNDKRAADVADVEKLRGAIMHRLENLQKLAHGALEISDIALHDNSILALQHYKAAIE